MELKFDEKGLIPAIVQDHYTKEVLTLAYMNAESLAITIDERRTCFWSRSRSELWRKGDTSGAVQHVVAIYADCDADALVVEVVKDGPACHTGAESCFFQPLYISEELKGARISERAVVTDGNITTAKGMGVALEFALELVRLILGKSVADQIEGSVMKA